MGVVTIKTNKRRSRSLQLQAHERAHHLLEGDASRVLVVYGSEEASLYFESEGEVTKARPTK